jgi:hypothetical protein
MNGERNSFGITGKILRKALKPLDKIIEKTVMYCRSTDRADVRV